MMESLAMNHPFTDGNKRVAFFASDVFLRLNGYFIECDSEENTGYVLYKKYGRDSNHTVLYRKSEYNEHG
jgi:prophage maintenance system killer protein